MGKRIRLPVIFGPRTGKSTCPCHPTRRVCIMIIHKTVIPAAGLGTRMLPAAKAVPKELLPILDRPTIQYVIEEAAEAGITDAVVIGSRQKPALEEHFQPNPELEDRLKAAGRLSLLDSIQKL